MINILKTILFDTKGSVLSDSLQLFGKSKQETYDPYAGLRGDYKTKIGQILGLGGGQAQTTPYKFNPAFQLEQPEVEKATESQVLGKLKNLPTLEGDIKGAADKYYDTRKTQLRDRHQAEIDDTRSMYNRLGLVSSTPGLNAVSDLMETQGEEFDALEAAIMQNAINQEMQAFGLSADVANKYITQGQVLGQSQLNTQKFPIAMSAADTERQQAEQQNYMAMLNSLLSGNPPESYFVPGTAQKIGMVLGGAEEDLMRMVQASQTLGN